MSVCTARPCGVVVSLFDSTPRICVNLFSSTVLGSVCIFGFRLFRILCVCSTLLQLDFCGNFVVYGDIEQSAWNILGSLVGRNVKLASFIFLIIKPGYVAVHRGVAAVNEN